MGYSPDIVLPVSWRGVPALRDYIGSINGGDPVTIQTHQHGIPIDIRKLSLYQRRNLYAKMCEGKRQYFTERSAIIAVNNILDLGIEGDKNLSVYICPFCGWWHFGHRPWDVEDVIKNVIGDE